ncbi:stonustoxin subunit beta-like [Myxocyprinus asiaticus]|uniref:stonustoxin subunit beta-like n=1 Tax=Myxocyprinus asiaticus TaxID=70543 RepID=UPI0022239648|nr:stonustoxin subunit beta-like [Myxocyprinus asiaticus]XP_051535707.1 stonustoxin subunit beta-like [Myxocyprinus asiaticus]
MRLSGCMVTQEGCSYLASAPSSNPSHLRGLDLSYNHPGSTGVTLLSARLQDPNCKLEKLNLDHGEPFLITPGLRKYACDLTMDPNTANPRLSLSEGNRWNMLKRYSHTLIIQRDLIGKNRFCVKSLSGCCYWEFEWRGWSNITVTYKSINRKEGTNCRFGMNKCSWSLLCIAWYSSKKIDIPFCTPPSNRLGVYLDWAGGTLSFYNVSHADTLTHILHSTPHSLSPSMLDFGYMMPLCLYA